MKAGSEAAEKGPNCCLLDGVEAAAEEAQNLDAKLKGSIPFSCFLPSTLSLAPPVGKNLTETKLAEENWV